MADWFYGKDGQQYGPIDEVTLRARTATGEVEPQDKVWTKGMPGWLPLNRIDLSNPPVAQSPATHSAPLSDSPYAVPASGFSVEQGGTIPTLPSTNGLAIASLVCGILSLLFGIFLAIPAIICGHMSRSQLNRPDNHQEGQGMALAGLICGYAGIVLMIGGGIILLIILRSISMTMFM